MIFLHKLAPGGRRHSFGIHVARMAGMPPQLLQHANEVFCIWNRNTLTRHWKKHIKEIAGPTQKVQLSIFDTHTIRSEEIKEYADGSGY